MLEVIVAKFIETEEEWQRETAKQLQAARIEWARAAAAEAAGFKDMRDAHLWMAALCYAAASARIMEGLGGEDPRRTVARWKHLTGKRVA